MSIPEQNPWDFQAGDFHCARCGTLLDGGTDEPVAARDLIDRLTSNEAVGAAWKARPDVSLEAVRQILRAAAEAREVGER